MPWIIKPAYLGKKMVYISESDLEPMLADQTARRIFANWYQQQDPPPPPPVPVNVIKPFFNVQPQMGVPFEAENGIWQHNPDSFTYVWRVAGAVIAGATSKIYTPTGTDEGKPLTVEVTATNAGGSSAPAVSNNSQPILPAAEEPEAATEPAASMFSTPAPAATPDEPETVTDGAE